MQIADFGGKNVFNSCVIKERFFLTLYDAVLAALDKHKKLGEIESTAKQFAEVQLNSRRYNIWLDI